MEGLRHGPLGSRCVHLCVDMQRLFAPGSPWGAEWLPKVLPAVTAITAAHPDRAVFTRFVPPEVPSFATGSWRRYYQRWAEMTLSRIGTPMVALVPELQSFAPPARIVDKGVYSPWTEGALDRLLRRMGTDTLIVTGGETDVCVLGTVLGAVDRGYLVVLVTDAVFSSSDATHSALMELYRNRFSEQVEAVSTAELLRFWR
jgi:nicotinamidase-related amidase